MIRILIVARIRLFREGLAELIAGHADFAIVGAQPDPPEPGAALDLLAPDVILLDLAAPDSRSAVRRFSQLPHPIPIVALGIGDSDREVLAAAEAGAAGYVTREGSVDELSAAVRAVADAINGPGGQSAANLKVAELYIAAFGNLAKVGNTLIVPSNLSDVASVVSSAMTVLDRTRTGGAPAPRA